MADGEVRIEGTRELRRTLKRAGDDLSDLKEANTQAAETVANWGGVRAPRLTGALGASVRPMRQAGRARIVAGSSAVPYANVIHWGWWAHHIQPQPWLSDSAVETQPSWLPKYLDAINSLLAKIKGA